MLRVLLILLISFSLIFNDFWWVNALALVVFAGIFLTRWRPQTEPPKMGIIILIASALRILVVFLPGYEPFGLFEVHSDMANDIANGSYLFCLDKPTGSSMVYAAVGWIFGSVPAGALTLNLFLQVLDVRLAYLIGKRWRTEKIGRWCALALALYPDHIYYTHLLSSEVFFTTGLLLTVYLLVRSPADIRWWPLIGLVIGLMNYFRPLAPLLIVAAAVFELSRRSEINQTIARISLMTAAFLIVILPQSIHTFRQTGKVRCTSVQKGGLSFLFATSNHGQGAFQLYEYNHYLEMQDSCSNAQSNVHPLVCANHAAWHLGRKRISERTFVWLKYSLTKRLPLQFGGSTLRWAWPDRPVERWRAIFHLGSHLITALIWLSFCFILIYNKLDDPLRVSIAFLVFLVFLTHFFTEVNPRYAHPWTVLLLVFIILNGQIAMFPGKTR